ncbi:hypothetical protein QR680_018029 [Steinernema hermaphroditum]|uniref:Uncharacterized protein n=1 Tax=Steinernema hermaphroditum TaxID=289476 RepID=A0AA39HHF3_9BILA|nr:hypothetical protein QR680_018029 [Steinernema hermaphroditum]
MYIGKRDASDDSYNTVFIATYVFLLGIFVSTFAYAFYYVSVTMRIKIKELNDCMPHEDETPSCSTA